VWKRCPLEKQVAAVSQFLSILLPVTAKPNLHGRMCVHMKKQIKTILYNYLPLGTPGQLPLLLMAVWLFCAGPAGAQNAVPLHYTVSNGLPSSVVYHCTQDLRGFIWFATESGISRFDGTNFQNFSTRNGLTDTEILDIACSADGQLWLLPFGNSPIRFNPVTGVSATAATDSQLKKIVYRDILQMKPSAQGGLYFFYKSFDRLFYYAGNRVTEYNLNIPPGSGCLGVFEINRDSTLFNLPKDNLLKNMRTGQSSIVTGRIGTIISNNTDTFFSYKKNASGAQLYVSELAGRRRFIQLDSTAIEPDVLEVKKWNNYIYICSRRSGVFVYDLRLKLITTLLAGVQINSTFMDKDGNLWLCSSSKGVYCIPVSKINIYNTGNGLADNYVCSLLPLPDGGILAGFSTNQLQKITAGKENITITLPNEKNIPNNRTRKMILSKEQRVLVLSDNNICYAEKKDTVKLINANLFKGLSIGGKDLCEYETGRYLVSTTHLLLDVDLEKHREDTLFRGRTTTVTAGSQGDGWFGAMTGLYYINNIAARQYEYIGNRHPLLSRRLTDMVLAPNGLLWLASANAGMIVLQNNEVVANITTSNGLASDLCRSVFIEPQSGTVWVATNNGVSRIEHQLQQGRLSYTISNYNTSFGLPDNDINDVVVQNNTVYAGTANGLAVFPSALPLQNIPVHIVQVMVENKEMGPVENYTLRHFQDDINISFTGICYTCAGKIDYQYRMLKPGGDTTWNTTSAQTVNFSSLRPGRYTFQVKTAVGSNITTVYFYIKSPWFTRWWFWTVCICAAAGILWVIYRQRVKNIAQRANNAQKVAQLELQALQAQMNPHFIFNSLNAIQHFITEHDSSLARNYLGSFSKLMRLFLESSRSKYISIAQEKELLSLYLQLEQLRFNNRFHYSIETEAGLDAGYEIPSMLVQPFAENAINHGLFAKPGNEGLLSIRFYKQGSSICCEITDNGIGRGAAAALQKNKRQHTSRGMQITRERMKTLEQNDGLKTRIDIEDKVDAQGNAAGTRIIITITDTETKS
jgi:hypothetical protein